MGTRDWSIGVVVADSPTRVHATRLMKHGVRVFVNSFFARDRAESAERERPPAGKNKIVNTRVETLA